MTVELIKLINRTWVFL